MKKKEMISLTDKETEFYEKHKVCHICTDYDDKNEFKLYRKVRDHCHYTGKFRGAAHSICNLRYKKHQNKSIGKLAKAFNGQLECLGENTDKYITFSVPIS